MVPHVIFLLQCVRSLLCGLLKKVIPHDRFLSPLVSNSVSHPATLYTRLPFIVVFQQMWSLMTSSSFNIWQINLYKKKHYCEPQLWPRLLKDQNYGLLTEAVPHDRFLSLFTRGSVSSPASQPQLVDLRCTPGWDHSMTGSMHLQMAWPAQHSVWTQP